MCNKEVLLDWEKKVREKGRQKESVFHVCKRWGTGHRGLGQTKHTWSLWKHGVLVAKHCRKQALDTEKGV